MCMDGHGHNMAWQRDENQGVNDQSPRRQMGIQCRHENKRGRENE